MAFKQLNTKWKRIFFEDFLTLLGSILLHPGIIQRYKSGHLENSHSNSLFLVITCFQLGPQDCELPWYIVLYHDGKGHKCSHTPLYFVFELTLNMCEFSVHFFVRRKALWMANTSMSRSFIPAILRPYWPYFSVSSPSFLESLSCDQMEQKELCISVSVLSLLYHVICIHL